MTITALPTAPNKLSDTPEQFTTKADAWVAALATFTTQANALETNVNAKEVLATAAAAAAAVSETNAAASAASALAAPGTSATSVTSRTMATGSMTFTIQSGKSFVAGMKVIIAYASAVATQFMYATVTGYSSTTLTVTVESIVGSGTYANWVVSITGPSVPGFGEDQTWQNLTGSRSWNTTYTNTTNLPIAVAVALHCNSTGVWSFYGTIGALVPVGFSMTGTSGDKQSCLLIVPPGSTYGIGGGNRATIDTWYELR